MIAKWDNYDFIELYRREVLTGIDIEGDGYRYTKAFLKFKDGLYCNLMRRPVTNTKLEHIEGDFGKLLGQMIVSSKEKITGEPERSYEEGGPYFPKTTITLTFKNSETLKIIYLSHTIEKGER